MIPVLSVKVASAAFYPCRCGGLRHCSPVVPGSKVSNDHITTLNRTHHSLPASATTKAVLRDSGTVATSRRSLNEEMKCRVRSQVRGIRAAGLQHGRHTAPSAPSPSFLFQNDGIPLDRGQFVFVIPCGARGSCFRWYSVR